MLEEELGLLCVQFELLCTIIVCTDGRGLTEISERWIFVMVCACGAHFDMIHSKRGINRLLHSKIQDRRFPLFFPRWGGGGICWLFLFCCSKAVELVSFILWSSWAVINSFLFYWRSSIISVSRSVSHTHTCWDTLHYVLYHFS